MLFYMYLLFIFMLFARSVTYLTHKSKKICFTFMYKSINLSFMSRNISYSQKLEVEKSVQRLYSMLKVYHTNKI